MKAGLLNHKAEQRNNVLALAYGHQTFLTRNTGVTKRGDTDHFVLNPQGVLSNNRHFIGYTRMEYQPNGDATTEGQAVLIIGCMEMYRASGDVQWLEDAKRYWDAYVQFYYDGKGIPASVQPWFCNWIINGKEPVLSNWPIDWQYATHGGFKGVELSWSAGRTLVPAGAPYWGQYLELVTFAFDGALGWDAINAKVKGINEDGSTNWGEDGTVYDLDWLVDYLGRKVDWDGNILEQVASEPIGTVQLKDTSVSGVHKLNFATCNPVADGGYLLPRNKPWHNRPVRAPVQTNAISNAADAEQWFAEACHMLWEVTGESKYKMAFDCVIETCRMYSEIDRFDKFFRVSTQATTPFTDGISYAYNYPSTAVPVFDRDAAGLITIRAEEASQQTLEQQAIWYRVNNLSKLHIEYGGLTDDGDPLTVRAVFQMSPEKVEDSPLIQNFLAPLPPSAAGVHTHEILMNQLITEKDGAGNPYFLADARNVTDYGSATTHTMVYSQNILGDRAGMVSHLETDEDGGMSVGFYTGDVHRVALRKFTYRSGVDDFNLRIEDADGWRWWWMIPATNGEWRTIDLPLAQLRLSSYQPNEDGRPRPSAPNYIDSEDITILPDTTTIGPTGWLEWYAINDLPIRFNFDSMYTMLFNVTFVSDDAFSALLGNTDIRDFRDDNLAYTPGVIPFSNNLDPYSQIFDGWHGMPYPGYQYPWIWVVTLEDSKLDNMVNFLYDSQQWYQQKHGVLGPGAAAYYWNRWDNLSYGPADTFTGYHWGNGEPWAGYQPRAFYGAALAWLKLYQTKRAVPPKLRTYVLNWVNWLAAFQTANGGLNPTEFPAETLPYTDPDDFTGHMSALWLAGACCVAMTGNETPNVRTVIENTLNEIQNNYKVVLPNHPMNGSWSPAVRADTDNGMFFGFWAGETLRALGLYLQWVDSKADWPHNRKQLYGPERVTNGSFQIDLGNWAAVTWAWDADQGCARLVGNGTLTQNAVFETGKQYRVEVWSEGDPITPSGSASGTGHMDYVWTATGTALTIAGNGTSLLYNVSVKEVL